MFATTMSPQADTPIRSLDHPFILVGYPLVSYADRAV